MLMTPSKKSLSVVSLIGLVGQPEVSSNMPRRRRGLAHRMRKKLNQLVEPFRAFQRCLRRSRSQHQLAAGVAQFELSERVAHVVEGEDSGNRHFQLAPCNEVSQFGDHCCGCGIRAAF